MHKSRIIKFQEILREVIEKKGYSRNRRLISDEIGVSPAAVSQYIQGKAKPSFDVLVAIANFFEISLDYLVFGEQEIKSQPVDYGIMARYMDAALSELQVRTAKQRWSFARIARALAEQIDMTADRIASHGSQRAGLLNDEEVMIIEGYSTECWIISMDLKHDIINPNTEHEAAGRFLHTVAQNLSRGRKYRFLLPSRIQDWKVMVNGYIKLLQTHCGNDQLVLNNCLFKRTENLLMTGCGLYKLDVVNLAREQPILREQIRTSISDDGWIGIVISPSMEPQVDVLMDSFHFIQAKTAFEAMWRKAVAI